MDTDGTSIDDSGANVSLLEDAAELFGQHEMQGGARSRWLMCPRCRNSNCLMGCLCNGYTTPSHYDCSSCGQTIEAEEL